MSAPHGAQASLGGAALGIAVNGELDLFSFIINVSGHLSVPKSHLHISYFHTFRHYYLFTPIVYIYKNKCTIVYHGFEICTILVSIVLENDDVQLSLLCRVCGNKNDNLIPIFQGDGLANNLAEKIHSYLPIKVSAVPIVTGLMLIAFYIHL